MGFLSYVDDLEPLAEKLVGFVRQVEGDSALGRGIRLVDVDAADRAPKLEFLRITLIIRVAADGVVEDEDADGSGSAEIS